MPLVRISHVEGKSSKFAADLSHGVHRAMVETFTMGVSPEAWNQAEQELSTLKLVLEDVEHMLVQHRDNIQKTEE